MRWLVSPKRLLGHLTVLGLAAVFLRLAWWQWDRSQSATGTLQNLGYALQWPLFAVFVTAAWCRVLWYELHPPAARPAAHRDRRRPGPAGAGEHPPSVETDVPAVAAGLLAPGPAGGPATATDSTRRSAHRPAPPGEIRVDDNDAEVIAYNRYLAWLNARDQQRRR